MNKLRMLALCTSIALFPRIALADACADISNELATYRARLAAAQDAVQECQDHPGQCNASQMSQYQNITIPADENQIAYDEQQLLVVCQPTPSQPTHRVSVDGIEVIQAVQDFAGSVTLIAGKQTWVRVYLSKLSGSDTVNGTLGVLVNGNLVTALSSTLPVTVLSSDTLLTRRQTWRKTLNFLVPSAQTVDGTVQFLFTNVVDASGAGHQITCDGCGQPKQVSFFGMPPLRIKVVGLAYYYKTPAGINYAKPRAIDFTLIQSWLGRAYPVAQVTFTATTIYAPALTALLSARGGQFDPPGSKSAALTASAQVAIVRAQDIANKVIDPRTHYFGLVSDQGSFLRGKSAVPTTPNPAAVGSGPAGTPRPGLQGGIGDVDASYADWYTGHELGHLLGNNHHNSGITPTCTAQPAPAPYDPFPFVNGFISDGSAGSFVGLDVGDFTNAIPFTLLWGGGTHDVMTYCNNPIWLGASTFEAIRVRLIAENPGFHPRRLTPPPKLIAASFIQVVAIVNLSKGTGTFEHVGPVSQISESKVPEKGRAIVMAFDSDGRAIGEFPVELQLMSDPVPGEDEFAMVDAFIPYRDKVASLTLSLDRKVITKYQNSPATPPRTSGLQLVHASTLSPGAQEYEIRWAPVTVQQGTVTYTVQMTTDGTRWETLAVGLEQPMLALAAEQLKAKKLRVIATTGFKASEPTILDLPSKLSPN